MLRAFSQDPTPTSQFDTAPPIWFYGFMKTPKEMPDILLRAAKSVAAIPEQTLKQLVPTAIERELVANRTIGSTELSTEDYLRRLDALAQADATAWKTGKAAVEAIAELRCEPPSQAVCQVQTVGGLRRKKRGGPTLHPRCKQGRGRLSFLKMLCPTLKT